jgi:hypothetical protein
VARVVNSAFYLPFGRRNVAREAAEAAFVQDLLCYDRVWILTDQMSAVGMLGGLMGASALRGALEDGILGFVHDRTILAWPEKPGYRGPLPVVGIASLPTAGLRTGYAQRSPAQLVAEAIDAFAWPKAEARAISDLAEQNTLDLQTLQLDVDEEAAREGRPVMENLHIYKRAVERLEDFPVTLGDLLRMERDAGKLRRYFTGANKKFRVMRVRSKSGLALLESEDPISAKQLGLLNLVLADRVLTAMARVKDVASLHTEPVVASILAARLEQVRGAAGKEVDDVLRAREVLLPTLLAPGPLDYARLLAARGTSSGVAFRRLVDRRDADGAQELLPIFIESLTSGVAERFGVRLMTALAVYAVEQFLGAGDLVEAGSEVMILDPIVKWLLARRGPDFFVDTRLRRIASRSDGVAVHLKD